MITWQPTIEQSKHFRLELANKTNHAICVLVEKTIPEHVRSVQNILSQLLEKEIRGAPALLHPDVFNWYFHFIKKAKAVDNTVSAHVEKFSMLLDVIEASKKRSEESLSKLNAFVDFDTVSDGVIDSVERGGFVASRAIGRNIQLSLVVPDSNLISRIRDAYKVISEVWPEMNNEAQDFVRKLLFFKGPAVIGFTDFKYHGAIILKYEQMIQPSDPVEIAEEILHEASHVYLNTFLAVEPAFLNDDSEIFSSPLRKDPRPMFGLFHQAFVLTRLSHFYNLLIGRYDGKYQDTFRKVCHNLEQALDVINLHAKLTNAGRELVDSMNGQFRDSYRSKAKSLSVN